MIEGIRIELTTEELRGHINSRLAFHTDKAKWYGEQLASLNKGMSRSGMSNDPVGSLERSREEHRNRAAFFKVLADHLIPNETYRLSENDLARLEVASQFY